MKRLLAAVAVAIAGLAIASSDVRADGNACVRVETQAIFAGAGYNHVVRLINACDRAQRCTVSTDVAPDPIEASVAARSTVELVTFRGSPARVFVAKVTCRAE